MAALDDLPGEPVMWVLIVSELAVFALGLAAFLVMRIGDPAGFAEARVHLHPFAAGVNTIVLVTSGLFAALACIAPSRRAVRLWLAAASLLGVVFLVVKGFEFGGLMAAGIGTETHPLFMFYFLLTGFHAAHVAFGILVLAAVGVTAERHAVETGVSFWHMVDLIWVFLFPIVYLLP